MAAPRSRSGASKTLPAAPPPAPPAVVPTAFDADALARRIREAVAPADGLEELWVQDAVDLTIEIARLRWLKQRLIATARQKALASLLGPIIGHYEREALMDRWTTGSPAAEREAAGHLAKVGLTPDDIEAKAFELRIKEIGQVEAMTAAAEARRNAAIREIERYRTSLAARLRSAAVEDAEYTEVDTGGRATREVGGA